MNTFTKRRFYDMIIARNEITIRLGEKRGEEIADVICRISKMHYL